jgi:hypothetical protein
MAEQVVITGVSGGTNFNVWIGSSCEDESHIYLGSISVETSSPPYIFNIPPSFLYSSNYCIQLFSEDDCLTCKCFSYSDE